MRFSSHTGKKILVHYRIIMPKTLVINAQRPEELRAAIVSNRQLIAYQVDTAESGLERGNIYLGVVKNIEKSLNAAFVDYGNEKNGFLALGDVVPAAYHKKTRKKEPSIHDLLRVGEKLIVQIRADMPGNKGASLTTNVSLPGRYVVIKPYDDGQGVSRKLTDENLRESLHEKAKLIDLPKGFGYIVRTNAANQSNTTLKRDATSSLKTWNRILDQAKKHKAPFILHDDQDLVLKVIRDLVDSDVKEIIIDDKTVHKKAKTILRQLMPGNKLKISLYDQKQPLFVRYHLEKQLQKIADREVELSGGGSIVFDATEALMAIDVNSAKSKQSDIYDDLIFNTNKQAAKEIARQLRLRNIGGLIVVDFIDMRKPEHRKEIEDTLKDAMKIDRARHDINKISKNGLLEINRQRIGRSLGRQIKIDCPTCAGTGRIQSPERIGLSMLRDIEALLTQKKNTSKKKSQHMDISVYMHPDYSIDVQNRWRHQITQLELAHDVSICILSDSNLARGESKINTINNTNRSRD